MRIPRPTESPEVWDTCQIGDVVLPGACKVTVERSQKIDVREGAGTDGATETDRGASPAKVTIKCKFGWYDRFPIPLNFDPWDQAIAVVHALQPVPGKTSGTSRHPKAIIHPAARIARVKSIKIEKIKGPTGVGKQMYEIDIDAIEFFPSPKKNTTATAASADALAGIKAGVKGIGSGFGAPPSPYDDAIKSLGQLAGDQLNTGAP